MKKAAALLLVLALALAACVSAWAEAEEETVRLDLEIGFEKNAYFSTYDVKVFVDDEQVAVMDHGIDYAGTLMLAPGKHIIRFEEAGSSRPSKGETLISISGPSLYHCEIHAKSSLIKITDERTEEISEDRPAPGRPPVVAVDGENRLQVSVEFTKNGLFSKYDVDLYCDDVLIARMPHGKDYEGTWLVSSGTHLIMFCKAGDRSVRGSVTVKAEGDAAFSCRIEAERNKVRIDRDRLTY